MDTIQAVTVQPSTLLGCQKEELGLHSTSSENIIDTPALGHVIQLFDVIVLPGTDHAGKPLIGISQRIKFRERPLKSISCCQQRSYHQPLHRKSAGFNQQSASFIGKGPDVSAPGDARKRAESPVQADFKLRKNIEGFWVSKSEHSLISVHPGVRKRRGLSGGGRVQGCHEASADPLFHSKSDITRGSLETCNLIWPRPQRETTFDAGNLEFVFVTYDMEESEQAPHPDLESGSEDPGEDYDPFYKCAFQFAKKHGYGFVEFVEEKVLGKKPKKRVLRKKNQALLLKKDDRVSPVYSVSGSSKRCRIHRDRCVARPKGNFVGLSNDTSPFKLAAYEKRNVKKVCRDADKMKTRSVPAKTALPEFVEELSPSRKMPSKERSAVSGAGAVVSPGRVDTSVDQYHSISQTSPSSVNDVRKYASGQSRKRNRKAGNRFNKISARSASAIVEDALNTSKNMCPIAERPEIDKTSIVSSQSLDSATLDNTLDILKESQGHDSYSKKQTSHEGNEHTDPDTQANQKNVPNEDNQMSDVVVEEPSLEPKPRTVLPRLREVTSLEYKLYNSMSATIFRETQLAQKMAATSKHSDQLSVANVDLVRFTHQPVHGEDRDRAPSCECPTRHKGRAHRAVTSSQCMLSAGSSLSTCARRKPHAALHVAHSSPGQCDRVESWPSLLPQNPSSLLLRSPEAKIATCGSPPPMTRDLSTVGDSPTKFEFNCDSSSKTLAEHTGVNLQNGINEQGLDVKLPAGSSVRDMILPASVPQVREHCRLRQSVGPYNFEDGDIRDMACSFILYSSKSCKALAESKVRAVTLGQATCGRRSAISTTSQGSANNNKCAAYSKDLADVYGECSYAHSSPDSSGAQDTNNNAVLQTGEVSIQNTGSDYIRVKPGRLMGSVCNQAASKDNVVQQKHHMMRSPVFFPLHEQIFPECQCLLYACHGSADGPSVTRDVRLTGDNRWETNQQRCNSVIEKQHKNKRAYLARGCKNVLNVCSSYEKNLRRLKGNKFFRPSWPSKSGHFLLKDKQSDLETDRLAASQYTTMLDANNNNSNNVRRRPPVARKTTVKHPRTRTTMRRKDNMRLKGKRRPKQTRPRGRGVQKPTYSITRKGLKALQQNKCDGATYSIGPVGYQTLYETLRQRFHSLHQRIPPAKCLCRRVAVCCSCNVLENMVDSFRNLITLFPEKRLQTLQKILGLTVSPKSTTTTTQVNPSCTDSSCSSSPIKLNKDANTSKSQRNVCKQRPGTIYQSVVPSANTCCNNMINPLSCGYCTTCGRPGLMTGPIKSCACQVYDSANKRVHVADLQPVDSLTLAKERLAKAKDLKDAKRMSKSNNASENAWTAGADDGGSILPSHVINDGIATPVINQGPFCKQQVTNIFPVAQQLGNMDVLSGIQNLEYKKQKFKNYVWPSKLSVQSGQVTGANNHKSKTVKWNISFEDDVDAEDMDFKQQGFFSRNQADPDHLSCGVSLKCLCDVQSCARRSRGMHGGDICGKNNGFRLESTAGQLYTRRPGLKRQAPGADKLELHTKEGSGSARKILWKSPRKVVTMSGKKVLEDCNKTATVEDLAIEDQNQSRPKELLNTVTRKLVEEFFHGYSAVKEDGTSIEHKENNECPQQGTGNCVANSVQLTEGTSSTTARDLILPDSDAVVSECLHVSNYDTEGLTHSTVISCPPVKSGPNLQQVVSCGSRDISSCNTRGSNNTAVISPLSAPLGPRVPQRVNSGPANMSSCCTHSLSRSTGLFNLPAASWEPSLQEVDEKLIPSIDSGVDVEDVVNKPPFAAQTSNPLDERISPTDASDLSMSSVSTQPYLKVNSPGISTHWVCVLPQMPPLHTCSTASGKSRITGSDNNSTLQCGRGSLDPGSQSSFSMAVVTPSNNSQNQLSSTDDESEEADACNEGSALRESRSSAEVKDVGGTTILSREQPSSSNSVASSASGSQCNNNNNTVPSLPPLPTPGRHVLGDHLETMWGTSRQQLQKSSLQGRLATLVASKKRYVNMATNVASKKCYVNMATNVASKKRYVNMATNVASKKRYVNMGSSDIHLLLQQNADNESVFRDNHEVLLNGNHDNLLSENHENLHIENYENLRTENHENLHTENHENLHSGNLENMHSGNRENLHSGNRESLLSGTHEHLYSGNHESTLSGNHESMLSGNHENMLSGNHESLHIGNHENSYCGNHEFQLFMNHKSWLAVNPERTLDVKHENFQAVTSSIVNSEPGKIVSRKRRMNEPLDNMASPPKIRRLNTSWLQPLDPGQTCQESFSHTRLT